MTADQIKDEIRKLDWFDRFALYRWINDEIAGSPRIGADRSLQIREEIEGICKLTLEGGALLRGSVGNAEPQPQQRFNVKGSGGLQLLTGEEFQNWTGD